MKALSRLSSTWSMSSGAADWRSRIGRMHAQRCPVDSLCEDGTWIPPWRLDERQVVEPGHRDLVQSPAGAEERKDLRRALLLAGLDGIDLDDGLEIVLLGDRDEDARRDAHGVARRTAARDVLPFEDVAEESGIGLRIEPGGDGDADLRLERARQLEGDTLPVGALLCKEARALGEERAPFVPGGPSSRRRSLRQLGHGRPGSASFRCSLSLWMARARSASSRTTSAW